MKVEVMCEKSFSEVDMEVINRLVEFHEALIDADIDVLDKILSDDFELTNMFSKKQSKNEFITMVNNDTLDYSKSDIMEPTILWDDEDTASLVGDIRMTAKINGNERRWISKAVISFKKINGKWCISNWDN